MVKSFSDAIRLCIWLILAFGCFTCTSLQTAQESPQEKEIYIPIRALSFEVDALKQIYLIDNNNDLIKRNLDGSLQYVYGNNRNGPIEYIDVMNPLQTLVFYKEFQALRILDRTLDELLEINLPDLGFNKVPCVASSSDNGIWIFDQDEQQLIKIDQRLKQVIKSDQLDQVFQRSIMPIHIKEYKNKVYLLDESRTSFYVFDNFAEYIGEIKVKDEVKGMDSARLAYLSVNGHLVSMEPNFPDLNLTVLNKLGEIDLSQVRMGKIVQDLQLLLYEDHLLIKNQEF